MSELTHAGAPLPPPLLLAEHPALDFLNSVSGRSGRRREWLGDGAALLAWEAAAGLLPPPVATRLCAGVADPRLDAVAARARELREWWRAFVDAHAGRTLSPAALPALEPLNRLLAEGSTHSEIAGGGAGLVWRRVQDWQSPDALLQPIAASIGDLLCHVDFCSVRQCEGVGCTLWFRDTCVNRTRRWCSMAHCGNRAKAAAHRARQRLQPAL